MSMSATAASTSTSSEAPTRTSAVRPPLGVTSNFDDPPDAGHDIAFFVTIISTVLIFSLFLVRGYAKFAILRQVTPEDGRSCNPLPAIQRLSDQHRLINTLPVTFLISIVCTDPTPASSQKDELY